MGRCFLSHPFLSQSVHPSVRPSLLLLSWNPPHLWTVKVAAGMVTVRPPREPLSQDIVRGNPLLQRCDGTSFRIPVPNISGAGNHPPLLSSCARLDLMPFEVVSHCQHVLIHDDDPAQPVRHPDRAPPIACGTGGRQAAGQTVPKATPRLVPKAHAERLCSQEAEGKEGERGQGGAESGGAGPGR